MSSVSLRALNRATLARQLLLERAKIAAVKAVEQLGGMQAQLARPPYIGLWSRVADFEREQLTKAAMKRQLVRATTMRGTLHLLSAKDYVAWRSTFQPMFDRVTLDNAAEKMANIDIQRLVADARRFFPCTFDTLRKQLVELHPGWDDRAMGLIVRMYLPLVQVPSADMPWGWHGTADFEVAETWLGKPVTKAAALSALAQRFLAAFGPATAADFQTWSGLTGGKEIFEKLRPKLNTFRDPKGRELFDLPKAPRPREETNAPVRFLPDYDNLLLAHADRSRVIPDEYRGRITPSKNLRVLPVFLVDGFVAGTWDVEAKKGTATLLLHPFAPVPKLYKREVEEEADRLIRFIEEGAERVSVRWQ
ncbi:MAG TPA: winged helix DNA-binding domain-containing protein [Thermoanaerobaculia bacterium]